jgi:hypothetical protein
MESHLDPTSNGCLVSTSCSCSSVVAALKNCRSRSLSAMAGFCRKLGVPPLGLPLPPPAAPNVDVAKTRFVALQRLLFAF